MGRDAVVEGGWTREVSEVAARERELPQYGSHAVFRRGNFCSAVLTLIAPHCNIFVLLPNTLSLFSLSLSLRPYCQSFFKRL